MAGFVATLLAPLRSRYRQWREPRVWRHDIAEWRGCADEIGDIPLHTGPVGRLLILPSDPWTLTGAVGDDAMIEACAREMQRRNPDLVVAIATATAEASAKARAKGFEPLPFWNDPFSFRAALRAIRGFAPDMVATLGADVMDGYYHPLMSMRLLLVSDLAVRLGAHGTLLGFSFNTKPDARLKPVFEEAHPRLKINVRDRISMARFRDFSDAPADQVADVAFLLHPDTDFTLRSATQDWLAQQRAEGRPVLGFNIHPMLFRHATSAQVEAIIATSVSALSALLEARSVSVLLIPHDYRGNDGDVRCLAPIGERLAQPRVHLLEGEYSAAQLKAIGGMTDGVVGARMHLLIATLGMGVPVAAVTYQDKFAGLFEHFGLPDNLLLDPAQLDAGALPGLLVGFADKVAELRAQVESRLPTVKALSANNLPPVAQGSPTA